MKSSRYPAPKCSQGSYPLRSSYVVLDDFGSIGRSYREAAEEGGDRESLIRDLMGGQYDNPVRIVCFNTARGTSRDATSDIAHVQDRVSRQGEEISPGLLDFIEWELDRAKRLSQTTSGRA